LSFLLTTASKPSSTKISKLSVERRRGRAFFVQIGGTEAGVTDRSLCVCFEMWKFWCYIEGFLGLGLGWVGVVCRLEMVIVMLRPAGVGQEKQRKWGLWA